jgi:hypothetical protein
VRIGSRTVAVVAITLIAGVRLAQAGQLAQAAEPSAPAEQFKHENPPPAAPAPPTAKPFDPSTGRPAVVIDDREVSAILSKRIRSGAGEDMGRIVDIIVSHDGQVRAAIIDFGGFLGIGTRKIAVDWRALNFASAGKPGAISVELTRNQLRLAPEYKRGEAVMVVGAPGDKRLPPTSEAAAPER